MAAKAEGTPAWDEHPGPLVKYVMVFDVARDPNAVSDDWLAETVRDIVAEES